MKPSPYAPVIGAAVVGTVLAFACGVMGAPQYAHELPVSLLFWPSGLLGLWLGVTFRRQKVLVTIGVLVPFLVLAVLGASSMLPYMNLPDPWWTIWGAHAFTVIGAIHLAPLFSSKRAT